MDFTIVTSILRKRFDPQGVWAFRVFSGLVEPAHAGPVYIGVFYDVLQIPPDVAGKGIVTVQKGDCFLLVLQY